jgi:hypothetical protein
MAHVEIPTPRSTHYTLHLTFAVTLTLARRLRDRRLFRPKISLLSPNFFPAVLVALARLFLGYSMYPCHPAKCYWGVPEEPIRLSKKKSSSHVELNTLQILNGVNCFPGQDNNARPRYGSYLLPSPSGSTVAKPQVMPESPVQSL